jgi:hypothetical protein
VVLQLDYGDTIREDGGAEPVGGTSDRARVPGEMRVSDVFIELPFVYRAQGALALSAVAALFAIALGVCAGWAWGDPLIEPWRVWGTALVATLAGLIALGFGLFGIQRHNGKVSVTTRGLRVAWAGGLRTTTHWASRQKPESWTELPVSDADFARAGTSPDVVRTAHRYIWASNLLASRRLRPYIASSGLRVATTGQVEEALRMMAAGPGAHRADWPFGVAFPPGDLPRIVDGPQADLPPSTVVVVTGRKPAGADPALRWQALRLPRR